MAEKRKKRILLIGDNGAMIDDMFNMLSVFYTIISSSIRFEDLENHIVILNRICFFCVPAVMTRSCRRSSP